MPKNPSTKDARTQRNIEPTHFEDRTDTPRMGDPVLLFLMKAIASEPGVEQDEARWQEVLQEAADKFGISTFEVQARRTKQTTSGEDREVTDRLADNYDHLVEVLPRSTRLFVRGEKLVLFDSQSHSPTITEAGATLLRLEADRLARFHYKNAKGTPIPTSIPHDAATAYATSPGAWTHKTLVGIAQTPIIAKDGDIITGRRWHEVSDKELLWLDAPELPELPDLPTKRQAGASMDFLLNSTSSLAFESGPGGRDHVTYIVFGLLNAALRASIPLSPMMVIDAPFRSGSGVGKGLATHLCSVVAQNTKATVITYGESLDELDKRLTAAALRGDRYILIDNVNQRALGGANLNSLLTESPSSIRTLGFSTLRTIAQRSLFAANGNGIIIKEDLLRRTGFVKMDTGTGNAYERYFAVNLLHTFFDQRNEILRHLFTVVRWAIQQGDRLPRGIPIGSFGEFARLARDPVLALTGIDPQSRLAEVRDQDPETVETAHLFETCWRTYGDGKPFKIAEIGNQEIKSMLYELAPSNAMSGSQKKRAWTLWFQSMNRAVVADFRCLYIPPVNGHDVARASITFVGPADKRPQKTAPRPDAPNPFVDASPVVDTSDRPTTVN